MLFDPEVSVLVLSPHLDDALLSSAAVVLGRPTQVWTVFAGRPDPPQRTAWDLSCGFADSDATMATRWAEDDAGFADTPARVRRLDCLDGPYAAPARRRADLRLVERELQTWISAQSAPLVVLPAGAGVRVPDAPWSGAQARLRARRRAAEGEGTADAVSPPTDAAADAAHKTGDTEGTGHPTSVPSRLKGLVQRGLHLEAQHRRQRATRRGMAANPDHLALRDVALGVCLRTGARAVLAEDLPYLWHGRADEEVADVLRRTGSTAQKFALASPQEKFDHLQAYRSQLDVIDTAGRLSTQGHLPPVEYYWLIDRPA